MPADIANFWCVALFICPGWKAECSLGNLRKCDSSNLDQRSVVSVTIILHIMGRKSGVSEFFCCSNSIHLHVLFQHCCNYFVLAVFISIFHSFPRVHCEEDKLFLDLDGASIKFQHRNILTTCLAMFYFRRWENTRVGCVQILILTSLWCRSTIPMNAAGASRIII